MRIELTDQPEVKARLALIVYTSDDEKHGIVMQHALTERKGEVHMAEGMNVTRSTIETLLSLNAMQTLTFIPDGVVAVGVNSLAWTEPRTERPLLFAGASDKALRGIDGQHFPQPRLLFVARGNQLSVFALTGNDRPQATTPLYIAPYFNVFSNHTVCNGSMQRPTNITPENAHEFTHAFFYSNFVHGTGGKRSAFPGTHREMWDAARENGAFKDEWLLPTGLTLAQAIGQA